MKSRKVLLAILLGWVILSLPMTGAVKKKVKKTSGSSAVKFRSCKDARAAGYSDMKRGEPGYSPNLDRDNDGIACESK
jgi:hypothetical protein